jgi:DNA-binding HxlR family transcriptional regulator
VVEVLAALYEHPHTVRMLARACRTHRPTIAAALRALRAADAVQRLGPGGTWDVAAEGFYTLTRSGEQLVERLSDIDAWANAFTEDE